MGYTPAVALHGITRSVSSGEWTGTTGTDTAEYDFLWQMMSNAAASLEMQGEAQMVNVKP
jgi:hypothetical protein